MIYAAQDYGTGNRSNVIGPPDKRIYRVAYASRVRGELKHSEAISIFMRGRSNNELDGLTGCLLFHGDQFEQVLEGERPKVEGTLERIRQDTRHTGIEILYSQYVSKRAFSDFTMRPPEAAVEVASLVTEN